MAFTVQNDEGDAEGANAYIDVDFFTTYHDDQGTTPSGSPSDATIQAKIVIATRYIDGRFGFVGETLQYRQTTQWPRRDVYDSSNNYINGVPREIKEACAEYARIALTTDLNPIPARDETGQRIVAKSETVGPLSTSVSYAQLTNGSGYLRPVYPPADDRIRAAGLLRTSGRIYRG